MRISDADRSRALDELRRHLAAGRLDLDTFADRIAEAMAAETLADLDHARRELPTVRIADPSVDPAPGGAAGTGRRARAGAGAEGGHRAGGGAEAGAWGEARAGAGARGSSRRLRARLVVLLSVLVVAMGTCLLVLAHWLLALVLVAGWVVGVMQGRIRVGRHPSA